MTVGHKYAYTVNSKGFRRRSACGEIAVAADIFDGNIGKERGKSMGVTAVIAEMQNEIRSIFFNCPDHTADISVGIGKNRYFHIL